MNTTWSPLALTHQDILAPRWEALCRDQGIQLSEYSFSNDFLFREIHKYAFTECEGMACVTGQLLNGKTFVIPSTNLLKIDSQKLKALLNFTDGIFPVPDVWLPAFDLLSVQKEYFNEYSDYLFKTENIKDLLGPSLSSRRNLLHQFLDSYKIDTFELTSEEVPKALDVLEQWQASHQTGHQTDYLPCKQALHHMDALRLKGRICYANGDPAGFTIGELLGPETAVLHFSKTLPQYKGETPFLYSDFAKNLPPNILWINMEQDLGLESLRKAKQAYAPETLLKKWFVSWK